MANEQNLIPQNKRTKSEQREIARLGGKSSVKARRKKKYIKEQLDTLKLLDLKDTALTNNMRRLGIEEADMTIQNRYFVCISTTSVAWKLESLSVNTRPNSVKIQKKTLSSHYKILYL